MAGSLGIIAGYGAYSGVRALSAGGLSGKGRAMAIAAIVLGVIGVLVSILHIMR